MSSGTSDPVAAVAGLSVAGEAVRAGFAAATDWYLSVLTRVPADAWERPGLGEWNLRELAAHTARALTTIENYLADAPSSIEVPDAITYFRTVLSQPGVNAAVADRGRAEAARLGADLATAVGTVVERVRPLVDATADDAPCATPIGGIRFVDYLVTRTVELTIHTADLCAAASLEDQPPSEAAVVTLAVIGRLAAASGDPAAVIRALTGRGALAPGTNVLG
jgi:hypothetical protein